MRPVAVYGAGGHGLVVLDALERAGRQVVGFIDDATGDQAELAGYPIYRGLDDLSAGAELVIAIGDNRAREEVTRTVLAAGRSLARALHPTAVVGRDVRLGPGVMILAHAVVNPGTTIGCGAIINVGATVDHHNRVGDHVHIAPGVNLAGHVEVGDRSLIGIGASVKPGIRIGPDVIVGAGAAVVADVTAGDTVVGVPARPVTNTVRLARSDS